MQIAEKARKKLRKAEKKAKALTEMLLEGGELDPARRAELEEQRWRLETEAQRLRCSTVPMTVLVQFACHNE